MKNRFFFALSSNRTIHLCIYTKLENCSKCGNYFLKNDMWMKVFFQWKLKFSWKNLKWFWGYKVFVDVTGVSLKASSINLIMFEEGLKFSTREFQKSRTMRRKVYGRSLFSRNPGQGLIENSSLNIVPSEKWCPQSSLKYIFHI